MSGTTGERWPRRRFLANGAALLAVGWGSPTRGESGEQTRKMTSPLYSPSSSLSKDSVRLARTERSRPLRLVTNWYAQAEHGGFYQALATGIYADYGLQVEIRMGGTAVNVLQLLAGGAADFVLGSSPDALSALQAGIPVVTVAAFFQKDPQCLLAHPGVGIERLEDLRGKPIWVSPGANLTYWPFLRAKFGFTDEQKRPYNLSLTPSCWTSLLPSRAM